MTHILLTPVDKEGEVRPKQLVRVREMGDARRVRENTVTVVDIDGQRYPLWVVETPEEIYAMLEGEDE